MSERNSCFASLAARIVKIGTFDEPRSPYETNNSVESLPCFMKTASG